MKRLISVRQRVNLDTQCSKLNFKKLSKLIGIVSVTAITVMVGEIFVPVSSVKAAVNPKANSTDTSLDIGEAYSVLASAIANYTRINAIENIPALSTPVDPSNNVPETVIANQPIPNIFDNSSVGSSESNGSTAKLGFEPQPDLSKLSEVVNPALFEDRATGRTLTQNALMTIRPLQLLAMETGLFGAKPLRSENSANNQKSNTVSSQLIENLESGVEAIIGNDNLASVIAPELPILVAKVYLPETSDYGLSSGFVWPAQGLLTSQFGWRWGRLHQGVDIAAPIGTPIWATADGVIDFAGWNNGGYGKMIDILHSNGTVSRYAHLNAIYVKRGQSVNQSQLIAAMGNSGNSTGPHLHFEIRPNGRAAINPMTFLARIVSKG